MLTGAPAPIDGIHEFMPIVGWRMFALPAGALTTAFAAFRFVAYAPHDVIVAEWAIR
jgi:hypothetical protein